MKLKEKQKDGQAREPPKTMRFVIWCSGGEMKDDALEAFDELFRTASKRFGYRHAFFWGLWQCLRSFPRAIWDAILKLLAALLK